jgi:hypothetical protein
MIEQITNNCNDFKKSARLVELTKQVDTSLNCVSDNKKHRLIVDRLQTHTLFARVNLTNLSNFKVI